MYIQQGETQSGRAALNCCSFMTISESVSAVSHNLNLESNITINKTYVEDLFQLKIAAEKTL